MICSQTSKTKKLELGQEIFIQSRTDDYDVFEVHISNRQEMKKDFRRIYFVT